MRTDRPRLRSSGARTGARRPGTARRRARSSSPPQITPSSSAIRDGSRSQAMSSTSSASSPCACAIARRSASRRSATCAVGVAPHRRRRSVTRTDVSSAARAPTPRRVGSRRRPGLGAEHVRGRGRQHRSRRVRRQPGEHRVDAQVEALAGRSDLGRVAEPEVQAVLYQSEPELIADDLRLLVRHRSALDREAVVDPEHGLHPTILTASLPRTSQTHR